MDEQTPAERAFTELFQRLPARPLPVGFRDTVMARISAKRAPRPWEWVVAALLAIPNGAFLVWVAVVHGAEVAQTFANFADAILVPEAWAGDSGFYVDGLVLLSVTLVGVAAMLVMHTLLAAEAVRPRTRPT